MKGMEASTCHMISIVVRIVSFFSVLLNPIVYATTQKDINKYIHKNILTKLRRNLKLPRCFASTCIHKLPNNRLNSLRESKDKTRKPYTSPLLPTHASTTFNRTTADIRHQNKSSENTLVATDKFEQERKNKHFERRIWLASRLARSNTNEDGTINEESGSRWKPIKVSLIRCVINQKGLKYIVLLNLLRQKYIMYCVVIRICLIKLHFLQLCFC